MGEIDDLGMILTIVLIRHYFIFIQSFLKVKEKFAPFSRLISGFHTMVDPEPILNDNGLSDINRTRPGRPIIKH